MVAGFRSLRFGALTPAMRLPAILALSFVAACSSIPVADEALVDREQDQVGDLLRTLPAGARRGAPTEAMFVGQPVGRLDSALGAPDLVRQEGENEFRRYDLGSCRIYAVVMPAGGRVASLSTGGQTAGASRPNFSRCTATSDDIYVGS